MKLIIDTDPGIDDAMAILYAAAAPEIELIGLTSVFGNVPVEIATRNAIRLAEWAGQDIPVAEGAGRPLVATPKAPPDFIHGGEGFGDMPAEQPAGRAVEESAPEFLVRMAREHRGELVLCPIGPLTNIALAMRLDPDFTSNVDRIVLMGGSAWEGGNATPHAEANILSDPHAAAEVFASTARIEMVGLDVTHRVLCTAADFDAIATTAPVLGGRIQEMSRFYLHFYETVGKFEGCSLHDPAAIIAATHPHLFEKSEIPVRVVLEGEEVGRTVPDPAAGTPPVSICSGVDGAEVKRLFMERWARLW